MANWHVLATGSDSNTGATWSVPKATVGSALAAAARGDTIYVGDGSYGVVDFTKSGSSPVITVKKAIESDHGSATGWNSTMGDGQAVFSNPGSSFAAWDISMQGLVVDGQTGGGPGQWKTGFGFKVQSLVTRHPIDMGSSQNITLRHFEAVGNGGTPGQNDIIGIGGGSNITVSYAYLHDAGDCIFKISGNNLLFEYCWTGDYGSEVDATHTELSSSWEFSGPIHHVTWRYCVFTSTDSTGGLMFDSQSSPTQPSIYVYGCVFAPFDGLDFGDAEGGGNGLIASWTSGGSFFNHARVFNNTFINSDSRPWGIIDNGGLDNLVQNNLVYNCIQPLSDTSAWSTISHNHFVSTTPVGTNTSTGSGDPFVSWTTTDFRLTANTTAGTNVGAGPTDWINPPVHTFDIDMLGTVRGSGGQAWSRGAIQFTSGGGDITPPTVTITAPTSSPTYATSTTPLTIAGTASDNVAVTSVTWVNAAFGSGTATGTTSWSASVSLIAGTNVITVTAHDAVGNTSTDQITVTYTPPSPPAAPTNLRFIG